MISLILGIFRIINMITNLNILQGFLESGDHFIFYGFS